MKCHGLVRPFLAESPSSISTPTVTYPLSGRDFRQAPRGRKIVFAYIAEADRSTAIMERDYSRAAVTSFLSTSDWYCLL